MIGWKTVTVNGAAFSRRVSFCPLSQEPLIVDDIHVMSKMVAVSIEAAYRQRRRARTRDF